MKLQHLSILVSAMIITGSAIAAEVYNKDGNKLDIYGNFNGMRYLSSSDATSGDRSSIRYGFRGETQLNDKLIGFSTWEKKVGTRHAELSFAGIKFSDAGSIDYGRNYGVLHDVGSWTKVMPEFGGDTTISDNFLSGRADGLLTYRNTNFFGIANGLNFALQYQGKNDIKNGNISEHSLQKNNGDGYGLSITYDLGNGISAAAAVSSSNRTLSQGSLIMAHNANNYRKKAEAYAFGLKYDAYNLYLASLYSETYNMMPYGNSSSNLFGFAEKANNLELAAVYNFDFGLRPSIGYVHSRVINDQSNKNINIKKYIELGANYKFNKNVMTFIDYRINLLSKNDFTRAAQISTENIVAMGMSYIF